MRHPASAPIGKRFTHVLLIVAKAGMITTVGVAERLHPPAQDDRPRPAWVNAEYPHSDRALMRSLYPSSAALREAQTLCGRMATAGYLRRARPWSNGALWTVAVRGAGVVAQIEREPKPRQRPYKTDYRRRKNARERRAMAVSAQPPRCINENSRGTHGPATRGRRCVACHETHRRSA